MPMPMPIPMIMPLPMPMLLFTSNPMATGNRSTISHQTKPCCKSNCPSSSKAVGGTSVRYTARGSTTNEPWAQAAVNISAGPIAAGTET